MLKRLAPPVVVLLMALLFSLHPAAQQAINQSRPASPDGVVSISNVTGRVTVKGWEKNEITVAGTLGKGAERLEFEGGEGRTTIRVVLPEHARDVKESILDVRVPSGSRLSVDTVSADIEVSQVAGDLDLETVSGSVRAGGGARDLRAQTVSGSIDLDAAASRIRAKSVSGSIVVRAGAPEEARMGTVSGEIRYDGALGKTGSLEASTVSGGVEVSLPSSTAASFKVSTFSGGVQNSFKTEGGIDEKKMTGGRQLEFSTNGGGARVSIETFSGSIRLKAK